MVSSLWQPFSITLAGTPWRGVSSRSLVADRRFALKANTKIAIKTVPGARRIARQDIQLAPWSQLDSTPPQSQESRDERRHDRRQVFRTQRPVLHISYAAFLTIPIQTSRESS